MQIIKVDRYKHTNNRILSRGVEITIRGERGRFRFVCHETNEHGEQWITCYGGTGWRDKKGVMGFRSFSPDRIKTVHWKEKMR